MSRNDRRAALHHKLGRVGVYIEDGVFSLARVVAVEATEEGMRATMEAVPEWPLSCDYRADPPRFTADTHPVGDRWEISKRWEWFFADETLWDASLYMGFRILFAPAVVERFLAQDLSWVEDYF